MITLFSTNCPKCKVLENKLSNKNIDFVIENNMQEVIDQGFMTAPVLKINNKYLDFGKAIKWINDAIEISDCESCEV